MFGPETLRGVEENTAMDFAQQQRNPAKHLAGLTFVVLLHVAVIYALVNGLARKVVEVIKQPLETKIIEEVKPPPPPPEVPLPPPPKFVAPPPPYIPPPEVQIQQPPPVQNVITATTNVPPPEAPPPVAPRVVEAPPAPPPPKTVGTVCPNIAMVAGDLRGRFERLAAKSGVTSADVTIEFTVAPNGEVKDEKVTQSTNPLVNSLALSGVKRLGCKGQGQDIRLSAPFAFKLQD